MYKATDFEPPIPVADRVFIGRVLAPPISEGGNILLLVEGTSDVTPAGVDAVAILSVSLPAGQQRQTVAVRCHPCHAVAILSVSLTGGQRRRAVAVRCLMPARTMSNRQSGRT